MFAVQFSILRLISARRQGTLVGKCALVCALSVALAPTKAYALSDSDRATARSLAEEGYTALKAQKFDVAEDRFRRADALVHAPTLVVDKGQALMGLGRFVEAKECFELVLREGVADNAPAVWKAALQNAAKLLEEVKPKIAWLTISVPNVPNPLLKVDNKPVLPAAIGVRRATNPGTVTIEVSAEGYETKQQVLNLDAGGERALEVSLNALPPRNGPARPATPPPVIAHSNDSGHANRTLAYVALGVGSAGIVVGAITGTLALHKRSDLNSECTGSTCPRSAQSDLNSYHSLGLVSGIGFGVGLAGVAAGLVLLQFGGGHSDANAASAAGFQLHLNPGSFRVQGEF